jgi:hypothetical protein
MTNPRPPSPYLKGGTRAAASVAGGQRSKTAPTAVVESNPAHGAAKNELTLPHHHREGEEMAVMSDDVADHGEGAEHQMVDIRVGFAGIVR